MLMLTISTNKSSVLSSIWPKRGLSEFWKKQQTNKQTKTKQNKAKQKKNNNNNKTKQNKQKQKQKQNKKKKPLQCLEH